MMKKVILFPNESVIIKCYKKNYDSIFFTGEKYIHYCNTIQNTHLFKKSGVNSGVTFLLVEMKITASVAKSLHQGRDPC